MSPLFFPSGKPSQTVTYTYNDLNQQASVTDSAEADPFDPTGTTTETYDAEGDLIESDTPEGDIHYVFDPATGEHVETWTGSSYAAATTDILYGYDKQGRLASVSEVKIDGATPAAVSGTRYDADGNAISTTYPTTLYTYDAAGNKLTETLPDGEVTTYAYDALNRLIGQMEVLNGTTDFSQTFTLNDDGTRKSATQTQLQPDGSTVTTDTAWTYDADGRLSSEAIANAASFATPQGLVTTFALPAAYNPGFSGGGTMSLTWNGSAYLMSGMSASQIGLSNTNGEALLQPLAAIAYGGNGSDWVLIATTSTGVRKVESFTLANGTFTPDGHQSGFGGSAPAFTVAAASGFVSGDEFAYDLDNNRMSDVHAGATSSANSTTAYTYNGDDEQLTQSVASGGTTTVTTNGYDPNGSLTSSSTTGGATTTYGYDVRNKMVAYASGGTSATYVYDDDGDRVAETASGVTTYYLTDTQNPTGYDQPLEAKGLPTGTPTTTYFLGDHIFAQANNSGVVSYLLTDGHGSTQQMTSSTGVVTAAFRYDAFGDALNFAPVLAGTAILFGGDGVYDAASGLYMHSEGRPSLGFLFTQMNPPGYSNNSDPISLHEYLYSNADPVTDVDPSGLVVPGTFEDELEAASLDAELDASLSNWENEGGAIGEAAEVGEALTEQSADTAELEVEIGDGASNSEVSLTTEGTVGTYNAQGLVNATRLSPQEIESGVQFMEENPEVELSPSPHEGAEYVDQYGKTYDQMGGQEAFGPNYNPTQFQRAIVRHVLKSNDFTIIDLTGASSAQASAIRGFISGLSAVAQATIKFIGG